MTSDGRASPLSNLKFASAKSPSDLCARRELDATTDARAISQRVFFILNFSQRSRVEAKASPPLSCYGNGQVPAAGWTFTFTLAMTVEPFAVTVTRTV